MEERRQTPDGPRRIVLVRRDARIIFRDEDRGLHPGHGDVAERYVAYVMAAVPVGLDADALVRAVEGDAFGMDVPRSTGKFAADRQAVAMQEGAIGDGDVARRI